MAATVEGGGSYQRLLKTLERLQGTQIKTNIKAGGKEEELFSWLSEARLHYFKNRTGEKRLKAVKVRLRNWPYRTILRDRQVLDYATTYFQRGRLSGGFTRSRARRWGRELLSRSTLPLSAFRSATKVRGPISARR